MRSSVNPVQGAADKGDDIALKKKNSILPNFEERQQNMIKALFTVWCDGPKKHTMRAEDLYQKMTTFGLAPDLKFIEQVTNVVF